ncbi:MAG: response regulator, partial [Kaistella sp.]
GRDICKKLKENEITRNIPVVIMSASRGLEDTAIQSGANAFIAKPFEIDEVVNKLNQLTT